MRTMDNIFVLNYIINYIINRQIEKKEDKLVTVFIEHLRVTFDSMDREVLLRVRKRRGVREGIIERMWKY